MTENDDKIVFPSNKDDIGSSSNDQLDNGEGDIAAKRIQRLCPGVDVTSLQNKGVIIGSL